MSNLKFFFLIFFSFILTHNLRSQDYLKYTTLNSNCSTYNQNGRLSRALDAVVHKLEEHFKELKSKYPPATGQSNTISSHELSFLNIANNGGLALEVYCDDTKSKKQDDVCDLDSREAMAAANYFHRKICLDKSAFSKGSRDLENTIFHEFYHFIGGDHIAPHVDYTVICTYYAYGADNYLTATRNESFIREVAGKYCATGGALDLIEPQYLYWFVTKGSPLFKKNWLNSFYLMYSRYNKNLPASLKRQADLIYKFASETNDLSKYKIVTDYIHSNSSYTEITTYINTFSTFTSTGNVFDSKEFNSFIPTLAKLPEDQLKKYTENVLSAEYDYAQSTITFFMREVNLLFLPPNLEISEIQPESPHKIIKKLGGILTCDLNLDKKKFQLKKGSTYRVDLIGFYFDKYDTLFSYKFRMN